MLPPNACNRPLIIPASVTAGGSKWAEIFLPINALPSVMDCPPAILLIA